METTLVVVIVGVAVLWGCWASYRVLTGRSGCACSSESCHRKNACAKPSENDSIASSEAINNSVQIADHR